jgi:hypothetical protein
MIALRNSFGEVVNYKHIVPPIKVGNVFLPNLEMLEDIIRTSWVNILKSDFVKYQEKGEIILINANGGWCTLDDSDEIII